MAKAATRAELQSVTTQKGIAFHHVGLVVRSIAQLGAEYARSLGASWNGEIIHDPLQQARVTFMRCGAPDGPAIELVEPDTDQSPLAKFLSKNGGPLHHICYEVDSLEQQLEYCRSVGSLIIKPPAPAAAFGGRRIAWTYTKQKLLVEYLER